MKYFFTFILLLALFAGCKPKVSPRTNLQKKLITTMNDYLHNMNDYLHKTLQPGVEYSIKDVIYYPEVMEKNYICQFHVNMHFKNKDTSGIVAPPSPMILGRWQELSKFFFSWSCIIF